MEKPIIRLIGGENHGEPMQFPLPADKIAFIDSGSKYSAFLIAPPSMRRQELIWFLQICWIAMQTLLTAPSSTSTHTNYGTGV